MAKVLVLGDRGYFHCTGGGSHPHGSRDGTINAYPGQDFVTIDGALVALRGAQVQAGAGCYDIGQVYPNCSSFVTINGVPIATSDSTVTWGYGGRLDTGYFPYTASYKHVEHIG